VEQPGTTTEHEPGPDEGVPADRPLQRLQPGGWRGPVAIALLLVVTVGTLVWQPWGRDDPSSAPPAASPVGDRSVVPPSPSSPSSGTDGAAIGAYVSLTDNEWTVVALLAPAAPVSTEEPATQHPPAWAPDGPFYVLQQGLLPVVPPAPREGQPEVTCQPTVPPRERAVVTLPAGRVVYLGVTFPGMDPRAEVSASGVDGTDVKLVPVSPLVVRLVGLADDRRYTLPSTGPGGTLLFAMTPPGILPSGAYRFDVSTPTIAGRRLLYACVGP
jgi:hypothetical protein